jgi:alpha-acetolactate decarboxylase
MRVTPIIRNPAQARAPFPTRALTRQPQPRVRQAMAHMEEWPGQELLHHNDEQRDQTYANDETVLCQPYPISRLLTAQGDEWVVNRVDSPLTTGGFIGAGYRYGIGAAHLLSGELIMDKRKVYRIDEMGVAQHMSREGELMSGIPFAMLSNHVGEVAAMPADVLASAGTWGQSFAGLQEMLKRHFVADPNRYQVFRIEAQFDRIDLRTVRKPTKPGETLSELSIPFSLASVPGVLIGYYIPENMDPSVNIPAGGFHFHALVTDKGSVMRGGHVNGLVINRLMQMQTSPIDRVIGPFEDL